MIRLYTSNDVHGKALTQAAGSKGYATQVLTSLDGEELSKVLDELTVLVFDLTAAAFSADKVVHVLDALDGDRVPPVLYLLSSPADIELITQSGSIINQDYAFVPLEPVSLAARLEVLTILGARRKLTLETAITDRLTGLYNRKYFIRRMEEELYRSVRYNYNVSILLADIDFSVPGHELTEDAATVVMRRIAEFLKGRLRKSDIVARYKWDDFAFLLPDLSQEDGLAVANDVKRKLERLPVKVEGMEIQLKVYLGHVGFPTEGLSSAIDVATALEECCFTAKRSGVDGIVSYTPAATSGS